MNVFLAHSYTVRDFEFLQMLAELLRDEGHQVFEPASILGERISSAISAAIHSADALVAVLTESNPNVFYELGIAAGAGVPIMIASTAEGLVPDALASVPFVKRSGDSLRDAQAIARQLDSLQRVPTPRPTRSSSAEETLREAVRDRTLLESLSPLDFEYLVAELLRERGYVILRRQRDDAGVDLVATPQSSETRIVFEIKKLSAQSRVSVESVRRLGSAVANAHASLGVLVATGGFTPAALALASGGPILLRTLEELLAANSDNELLGPKRGSN